MERRKLTLHSPKIDYVTVLIILFFVLLTIGVLIYFQHRVEAINQQTYNGISLLTFCAGIKGGSS